MARSTAVPHCATHPDTEARDTPCRRCGGFACEACFEHPDHDLCPACSEAEGELAADLLVDARVRRQRRASRKAPRLAGLKQVGVGVGMVALNVAMIAFADRYYIVLFPAGGALIGLGLSAVITGQPMTGAEKNVPIGRRIFTGALLFGGLLAGIAADFLVG